MHGPRLPERPRRLLTLSRDRYGLSNGAGFIGLAFGMMFTFTGVITLYAACLTALGAVGLLPAPAQNTNSISQSLLGTGALLLMGGGHLLCGTLLLFTLRSKFDRFRDIVIVRSGWLGLWRAQQRLSDFVSVSVLPSTHWIQRTHYAPCFDIALERPNGSFLVVGVVSMSHELAKEVATEVRDFVGATIGQTATSAL